MKKIIYVYRRHTGGTYIMLYQSFIVLRSLGIPSSVLHVSEGLENIKDSVLIFLKHKAEQSLIDKLKNNNNIVILIPGDGNVFEMTSYFRNICDVDGVVVASDIYKAKLESLSNTFRIAVIPHNYDYFLNSDMFKEERDKEFRLFFGGGVSSAGPTQGDLGLRQYPNFYEDYFMPLHYALKDNSINNSDVTFDDRHKIVLDAEFNQDVLSHIMSDANPSKYNCHYAVRCPKIADTSHYWIAKSATKVVTAAGSEANIITSLDPPVRVLIDESYPYSIDTETDEFLSDPDLVCMDMIEYAKTTYKTRIWYDALDVMREIKKKVSTQSVTEKYLSFVEELL
jgi:hypothetical protein